MNERLTFTYSFLIIAFVILLCASCSIKPVCKTRNIIFDATNNLKLDVYSPRKIKGPKKVLIFVYGGNWVHGEKSLYKFFGKGMARKGIVCVVPDYRHAGTDAAGMAMDVAKAVQWVKENCSSFKGDSNHIYISGHSAGGHLAALVTTDESYFKQLNLKSPIKSTILIDAFGLDMYTYLSNSHNIADTLYTPTFSRDPARWKKLSPLYYLNEQSVPFMQLVGTKTYPAIKQMNASFYNKLKLYQPIAPFISVKGKRHIGMIAQFFNPCAKAYDDILTFMAAH